MRCDIVVRSVVCVGVQTSSASEGACMFKCESADIKSNNKTKQSNKKINKPEASYMFRANLVLYVLGENVE